MEGRQEMTRTKSVVAGALVLAAALSVVSEAQVPEGRLYAFRTKPVADCPALDWHVVVDANGVVSGMISWDGMKSMARATGMVNRTSKTFAMAAKEMGGQGRMATITGEVRADGWLVANVKGPKVDCKGIVVPWYTPPAGAGNG
jgi:hypothetical protein